MALPAGRYGVTKNQLLKIKKLPMNTIKLIEELTEKFDLLGTAAFKNSTSVVTDSTDLVESGAVKDAIVGTVGWCSTVLDKGVIANANVNGDGTINISTFSVAYFKVEANKKYTVSNCNDFTDRNLVFGYYVDVPVINAVSYNNSRTVIERGTVTSQTVTAPIDGYIAIRINNSTDNIRFEEGEVVTQSVEDKKCDNSVIAPTENGTTVQKSGGYAAGSHAIRNGAFITWKNAKAQGETINDASDYTSGDVAEELFTEKYTLTATLDGNSIDFVFIRQGKHVTVNVYKGTGTVNIDSQWLFNIGTLPSRFIPSDWVVFGIFCPNNVILLRIVPSINPSPGQVDIMGSQTVATWLQGCGCYGIK